MDSLPRFDYVSVKSLASTQWGQILLYWTLSLYIGRDFMISFQVLWLKSHEPDLSCSWNCSHTANVYRDLWGSHRFFMQYLWKRAVRITENPYTPQRKRLCMLQGKPMDTHVKPCKYLQCRGFVKVNIKITLPTAEIV